MKSEVKRIGNSQLELNITVPHKRVGEVLEKVLEEAGKEIKIKGFRKGQAPKKMVREKIDPSKARSEALNCLVTEAYTTVVKEHHLKPIVSPRVEIVQFEPEAEEGQDFVFKATTAERPEVNLGDYKGELKKLEVRKPSEEIVGPDGQPLKTSSRPSQFSGPSLDGVLQAVLKTVEVEIPEILVEGEVTRMLSRLVDQTARLGLTVEQYLQSEGKTVEQLRKEYQSQAQESLKSELVLEELAKVEKIEVSEKEIEAAIKANPDPETRKQFEKQENKWYIESILKRNKTIQKLMELAR